MNWTLFIIFCGIGVAVYFLWLYLYNRHFMKISQLLYANSDADGYLKALEGFQSKLFFSKKMRDMLKIDAYMMKDDRENLEKVFADVDKAHLLKGDRFVVTQKKVTFYCEHNEKQKAHENLANLRMLRKEFKDDEVKRDAAIKECEYLVAIKVDGDGKFAEELSQKADTVNYDVASGIYLLRSAQSYYLRNDKKMCMNMLEKASVKLRNTSYEDKIKEIIRNKDYEQLMKSSL